METAQAAANEEEKSSAGDKYETTRAMMQIERDKAAGQLEEGLKLKRVAGSIIPQINNSQIGLGSLVMTNTVHFYIGISAGKVEIGNQSFLTVSAQAPIALTLLKLKQGDSFMFNKLKLSISEIA
ncbi:3-oxoacyl-ACP synthase [Chryseotalea sanaruensis]|uniref:3-oxoacyl-ACP synthase n=2 Tax=Chryseotalea sanaruensis TaxID=2482724 RepID=A0A401UBL6_9BACT|nr:3-oxoacyl-ACP synthase [Chryseotalea sanaruensis]